MYRGCNEKALSSQAAVCRAMGELMEFLPYNAISVSMVCRKAGVSRQTFYSLFTDKDDVVAAMLALRYAFSPGPRGEETCLGMMCRAYSDYIVSQREFLALLVNNRLTDLFRESVFRSLLACDAFLPRRRESDRQLAAGFAAGGLAGVVESYIRQGSSSREELDRVLLALFSGGLFD